MQFIFSGILIGKHQKNEAVVKPYKSGGGALNQKSQDSIGILDIVAHWYYGRMGIHTNQHVDQREQVRLSSMP